MKSNTYTISPGQRTPQENRRRSRIQLGGVTARRRVRRGGRGGREGRTLGSGKEYPGSCGSPFDAIVAGRKRKLEPAGNRKPSAPPMDLNRRAMFSR